MKIAQCFLLLLALAVHAQSVGAENLYEEGSYRPLTSDDKAWKVGDNLTVIIVETATASAAANTSTAKDGALTGSLSDSNSTHSGGVELSEDFKGGGKAERSGKLVAQITVTVKSISPGGNLHIRGEQDIKINDERQLISIEGNVRPRDISADNSVLSTRVGDARVSYSGDGILNEKQHSGILSRLFTFLGLL